MVARLHQRGHNIEAVNVAAARSDPNLFLTYGLRLADGWGSGSSGGKSPISDNPALVSELAALRYTYDPRGRNKLEAKDQTEARLGRSPDLADAAMLAFEPQSEWTGSMFAYLGGATVDLAAGTVVKSGLNWRSL